MGLFLGQLSRAEFSEFSLFPGDCAVIYLFIYFIANPLKVVSACIARSPNAAVCCHRWLCSGPPKGEGEGEGEEINTGTA